MIIGFPTLSSSAKQGELGVALVARIASDSFGWLFKRNHQEHDFGIDGQLEVVTDSGAVTGQLLAMQIKCGRSFLQEKNKWGYVYRGELKHFNYLSNYPIPVLIIVCDPESGECFWVRFQPEQTQTTEAGWKITVPFENRLSQSKAALLALLPPPADTLAELRAYWALNKMIVESGHVLFVFDDKDVLSMDTSRPRAFFDRLRSTKELAYECQGKIEFSISGYDNDPRELFEIPEVRRYMAALEAALPELLFFVRTEQPTATLRLFALCLTTVSWEGERSTRTVTRRVIFETEMVGTFFMRQFPGLNAMAEWLGMSIEENKRITYACFRCLGFNPPDSDDA
ncbi:DUF4365 and DUF1817 domain-containing protein [Candidatus Methylomirabilis sp.]|uniref:DUF4365 and DUF1817 domain-containing protein n=1 Tax=Candidatus Methylomirabilis sp. TaxID=2032687 RepID=UPI002A5DCB10|nr:DUF4365 and DUF1817 domain-containing protein [Candidatus Methylomirabilis sp.]